ncbi:MAG: YeeE/YedE family protein [Xanthobacteraceae bacterium]
MTSSQVLIWGGLAVGILFGIAARLSSLCLLSGLRGWWLSGDGRPIRTFALAIAVALAGSQALQAAGVVDLSQSIYVRDAFSLPLLFGGGLLFGIGMVMANGCGARALVLLGGGNLRSLVVLVCIGIGGYVALTGLLGPLRVWAGQVGVVGAAGAATIPGLLEKAGLGGPAALWLTVIAIAGGLGLFALSHAPFRKNLALPVGGAAVGCAIVAGWYVTGALGADEFEPVPVASATFIAPVGDTILYAMLSTGKKISFGVTLVVGVALGSFMLAAAQGALKLQGFASPAVMLRYMAGGVLMGIGGAFATGCSVGQGMTGLSTLALMSIPAAAGIVAGTALALPRQATESVVAGGRDVLREGRP